MSKAAIAARIRELLEKNKWSEGELSRRAGFKTRSHLNSTLTRLEKGSGVELETLEAIAKGANVSLLWLQYGNEVPAREDEGTAWRRIEGWDESVAELMKRAPTIPHEIIERLAETRGSWAPVPMQWEWLLVQANHALKAMPSEERLRIMQARMDALIESEVRKDHAQPETPKPDPTPPLPGIEAGTPATKPAKKSAKG